MSKSATKLAEVVVVIALALGALSCHPPRLGGWEFQRSVKISIEVPSGHLIQGQLIPVLVKVTNLTSHEITLDDPGLGGRARFELVDEQGHAFGPSEGCIVILSSDPPPYSGPKFRFLTAFPPIPPSRHLGPGATELRPVVLNLRGDRVYKSPSNLPFATGDYRLVANITQDHSTIYSDTIAIEFTKAEDKENRIWKEIQTCLGLKDSAAITEYDSMVEHYTTHPYLADLFISLGWGLKQNPNLLLRTQVLESLSLKFMKTFPQSAFHSTALSFYVNAHENEYASRFKDGDHLHNQTIQALLDLKASTKDTVLQHFIDQELR